MGTVTITSPGLGAVTIGGGGPFDPPAGVTSISVECWGPGCSSTPAVGQESGGASGAYAKLNALPVAVGNVLTYFVGAGLPAGGVDVGNQGSLLRNAAGVPVCSAAGGTPSLTVGAPIGGAASNCIGDVLHAGADGAAAQSGGGSRGGSGGSSSGGPNGPGARGAAGLHSLGGTGAHGGVDVGAGGSGAAGGLIAPGAAGGYPGGGGGGGGSGANSNGGRGGDGQIRLTWVG